MPSAVRARLAQLPSVPRPTDPGIYFLWQGDRVIYIGKSSRGLCSPTVACNAAPFRRLGTQVKEWDCVTFQTCPAEMLDVAVRALVRLIRPKYNRRPKPISPEVERTYETVLEQLGFAA